jgi:tetratricopeptide (TPR) repeat protein
LVTIALAHYRQRRGSILHLETSERDRSFIHVALKGTPAHAMFPVHRGWIFARLVCRAALAIMINIPSHRVGLLDSIVVAFVLTAALLQAQDRRPQILYRDAVEAYDRGDVEKAIGLYREVLKRQPDSLQARANLGAALAHLGCYSEAVAEYRKALRQDPQNPVVLLNLALAWYKQAEFEKAALELQHLRTRQPENQQSLLLLADCYLRLGRYQDAVKLLQPAYRANPDDRAVDYALGVALINDGKLQDGEVVIDHILKRGNTSEVMLLMGTAQMATGEYKTAASTIRKALDQEASLPGGWSLYGRALLKGGDNENAKAAFRRALEADPNDFDANLYLGGLLRHDSRYADAVPYLERALRLRPASLAARFQVGAVNLGLGQLKKARKDLEQVERESPEFQQVHTELARLYALLHQERDSERERDIVMQLNEKARQKGPEPEP